MNVWTVKANLHPDNDDRGWHWNGYFFEGHSGKRWGGPDWIRSNASIRHIREHVRKDDLVVCYQTDDREIIGLTQMASNGGVSPSSGKFDLLDFVGCRRAFVIKPPLRIKDLRKLGCHPECFENGTQGTVFPVYQHEFCGIIAAMIQLSPDQEKPLLRWLRNAGWRWTAPKSHQLVSKVTGKAERS
jgi:hypothetical protein